MSEVKELLGNMEAEIKTQQKELGDKIEKFGADSAEVKNQQAQVAEAMGKQAEAITALEAEQKKLSAALARAGSEQEKKGNEWSAERKACMNYIKTGETKGLVVSDDPQAGYSVVPESGMMFDATVTELSPLRQVANVTTINRADAWETLVNKKGGVGFAWEGETDYNADTGAPSLGKIRIVPAWGRASVYASEQLLMDASDVDVESWIMAEAAEDFATGENAAFFNGDGVGKPRGFLTYDAGTSYGQIQQVDSGASGDFTTDGLLALVGSQKAAYNAGSTFMANRSVIFNQLFSLKDGEDRHYLVPDFRDGFQFRLLGFPLLEATDMPVAAADSLSLAFGNFNRGYQIVDRNGMTVLRDPYSAKPNIEFWIRKRVGGDVKNFEAIKLQKLAV